MRKLLTTKKCYTEHEKLNGHTRQSHKHPPQQPKILLTSNWWTRNDSSNVSGILHPDKYVASPRKLKDSKYEKYCNKTKGVKKKDFLGSNNCYCRLKTKPKLSSKPKKFLSSHELDEDLIRQTSDSDFLEPPRKYYSGAASESIKHYNSIHSQYFKEVPEYSTPYSDSIHSQYFNKGYYGESDTYTDFTQRQKDYDAFRESKDDYYNIIRRYVEEEEEDKEGEAEKKNNTSILTIMESRTADSQKGSSSYSLDAAEESKMSIEDLRKFRDEYYFETHNVDNLKTDIPEHTCVHQFRLDDRLLPEPVNADCYGISRCRVCNQPMADENQSEGSIVKNSLKCHFSPRKISRGGHKSNIELKLKKRELEMLTDGFTGRIRRPEYVNTFALRQQKMSL